MLRSAPALSVDAVAAGVGTPARDLKLALGLWVPIIRSWALTRGFALHPGTRNRYETSVSPRWSS